MAFNFRVETCIFTVSLIAFRSLGRHTSAMDTSAAPHAPSRDSGHFLSRLGASVGGDCIHVGRSNIGATSINHATANSGRLARLHRPGSMTRTRQQRGAPARRGVTVFTSAPVMDDQAPSVRLAAEGCWRDHQRRLSPSRWWSTPGDADRPTVRGDNRQGNRPNALSICRRRSRVTVDGRGCAAVWREAGGWLSLEGV